VIVAARTGSRRLPGKALLPLAGTPSILFLLRRLRHTRRSDGIILAATTRADDDALATAVAAENIPVFRGAGDDVVGRYLSAAAAHGFDRVVRVTGDCPFIDGATLDACLEQANAVDDFDLATTKAAFPVGIDYEIFHSARLAALDAASVLDDEDREHLTLHFYRNPGFALVRLQPPPDWPPLTRPLTLDTREDLDFLDRIANVLEDPAAPVAQVLATACRLAETG
jgi:spore coat polysaccharide biosynthesis protein SpsF (cytidylyltransferase family)